MSDEKAVAGRSLNAAILGRVARVALAADAYTRERSEGGWHELCSACEEITDEEIKQLAGFRASIPKEETSE